MDRMSGFGAALVLAIAAPLLAGAQGSVAAKGGGVTAPKAGAVPKSVTINDPVRLRVVVPTSGSSKYFVHLEGAGLLDCVQAGGVRHCDRTVQRHSVARVRVNRQSMGDPTLGQPATSVWIQRAGWQGQCAGAGGDVCELRMVTDRTLYVGVPVPSGG